VSSGNELLSEVHDQTSPSEMPASDNRDGQISESPVIRACQRAAMGTTAFPPNTFDPFSKKSDERAHHHVSTFEIGGKMFLTDKVARPGVWSEEFGIGCESFRKVY